MVKFAYSVCLLPALLAISALAAPVKDSAVSSPSETSAKTDSQAISDARFERKQEKKAKKEKAAEKQDNQPKTQIRAVHSTVPANLISKWVNVDRALEGKMPGPNTYSRLQDFRKQITPIHDDWEKHHGSITRDSYNEAIRILSELETLAKEVENLPPKSRSRSSSVSSNGSTKNSGTGGSPQRTRRDVLELDFLN